MKIGSVPILRSIHHPARRVHVMRHTTTGMFHALGLVLLMQSYKRLRSR